MEFNDLPTDCVLEVLNWLSIDQLFNIQRVNRKLYGLAAYKLEQRVQAVKIDDFKKYPCAHDVNENNVLTIWKYLKRPVKNNFCDYTTTFENESNKELFLSVLSKCCSVKSIDFRGYYILPNLLFEIFEQCPQLECIKIGRTLVHTSKTKKPFKISEAEELFKKFGSRIVHFQMHISYYIKKALIKKIMKFLDVMAINCQNLKQLDWFVDESNLTDDLMLVLKKLPRNCYVKVRLENDRIYHNYGEFNNYQDIVDELDIVNLEWKIFGNRIERLLKLEIGSALGEYPPKGIQFVNLLKLKINDETCDQDFVDSVLISSFPLLQEFTFNTNLQLSESEYSMIFKRMPSLIKLGFILTIEAGDEYYTLPKLSSIKTLKNLNTISFKIGDAGYGPWPRNYKPKLLYKRIREYINEFVSLKFDISFDRFFDYRGINQRVGEKIRKMSPQKVDVHY